ncbi:MAG: VWA domain-containing protein [Planctomycetaceae bacterium]|jgi:uncharacterized protein YegL|nr:VWA domain-containing protein [Planctomycetaceae bacterium]
MNIKQDRYQTLDSDPSPRLPVCFLIDCSFSMQVVQGGTRTGERVARDGNIYDVVKGGSSPRITEVIRGFEGFINDILNDTRAKSSVEIAIVTFSNKVAIERDFGPVDTGLKSLQFNAMGDGTRLGLAVKTGLQMLDRRKEDYSEYSISYYQPQLIILTDGEATDKEVCSEQARHVQQRMQKGKLISLPFLIGDEKEAGALRDFSPDQELLRIDGVNLVALFRFLSQSAIQQSRSTAGGNESVNLKKMIAALRQNIVPAGSI